MTRIEPMCAGLLEGAKQLDRCLIRSGPVHGDDLFAAAMQKLTPWCEVGEHTVAVLDANDASAIPTTSGIRKAAIGISSPMLHVAQTETSRAADQIDEEE